MGVMDDPLHTRVEAMRARIERKNGHAVDPVLVPTLEIEGWEPNRFPIMTASELAVRQGADMEMIGPFLFAGGITDLSGPVKWAGKTTYTLAEVKAILTGVPFLGV